MDPQTQAPDNRALLMALRRQLPANPMSFGLPNYKTGSTLNDLILGALMLAPMGLGARGAGALDAPPSAAGVADMPGLTAAKNPRNIYDPRATSEPQFNSASQAIASPRNNNMSAQDMYNMALFRQNFNKAIQNVPTPGPGQSFVPPTSTEMLKAYQSSIKNAKAPLTGDPTTYLKMTGEPPDNE